MCADSKASRNVQFGYINKQTDNGGPTLIKRFCSPSPYEQSEVGGIV